MRALLLTALLSASCYQPTFVSGHYKCDQPGDVCPSGFECVAGRCVDPKTAGADLASGEADMGTDPGDMSAAADLRQDAPDLLTLDMAPDMPGPAACTSLGATGGRDILACRAIFAGGNTAGICPSSYRVCNAEDQPLLDLAASGTTCKNLSGFYAAQISAVLKQNGDVQCEATSLPAGATWAIVGCGSEVLAANATTLGTKTVGNDCKKLKVLVPCDSTVKGWACTTGLSDATHTNVDRGGLLCCKAP